MDFNCSKIILILILSFGCLAFKQAQLKIVKDDKILPFDSRYVEVLTEETRASILESARRPLDMAISKGLVDIRGIPLIKLRQEFARVNVVGVDTVMVLGVGQFTGRLGSVYDPETRSVYVNLLILRSNPSEGTSNLVHEFLGALGYDDTNFQISTVLLSDSPNVINEKMKRFQSLNPDFLKNLTRDLRAFGENGQQLAGGATVVGGGGDEVLLSAKVFMLNNFKEWKRNFLPLVLKTAEFDRVSKEQNWSASEVLNDKLLDEYLAYFVDAPFENFTLQLGKKPTERIELKDLDSTCGVFQNEFSPPYIRLSRTLWQEGIASESLTTTHVIISRVLHTKLYFNFLEWKYRKH